MNSQTSEISASNVEYLDDQALENSSNEDLPDIFDLNTYCSREIPVHTTSGENPDDDSLSNVDESNALFDMEFDLSMYQYKGQRKGHDFGLWKINCSGL